LKALSEMKIAPVNSFDEEGEVFQNVYFQEHLYYINVGEFEKAVALVPIIENGLQTYNGKINKARVLAFQLNIMVMYFIMHRFKDCLQWMDLLLSDNSEIKQEQKYVCALLQPLVHFELGHEELVDNYSRAAYRLILNKNRLHDFERSVLKYLKTIPLSANDNAFTEKLINFNNQLQSLSNQQDFKAPLGMEEMLLWVESRLNDTKMSDILVQKINAQLL
jgi:hypothetical protein